MAASADPLRVVIVGAGFAGLAAARALTDDPVDDTIRVDVTLIDRHIYSTFQPLLYQVATGGLNPGDVAYPIRNFASRRAVRYRHGTVVAIEADRQRVVLAGGAAVPYDYLVIAVGADVNYFSVPGASANTHALYTRGEAIKLRDSLMGHLERLAGGSAESELSIVVVGGGATGVEMAGTLAELRSRGLPAAFPEVDRAALRVILVEQADELLPAFAPRLRAYALDELERRGVDVRFRTTIAEVGPDFVRLSDGSTLPAQMTVWAAGVTVPAAVGQWGLPQGRAGRIAVERDGRVKGQDRIFAVGDVALDPDQPLPQLAQPAIQSGHHAGLQIARLGRGMPTQPFRYRNKGTMATIGRRAAVVQLPAGVTLTGTPAWLAWLALHIVTLLGNRNRVSALLNLAARYLSWPNAAGVIVGDIADMDDPPR